MRQATIYDGTVVSVQGQNPGPASGISYTIDINMGYGSPRRVAGVKPRNKRLPDVIKTVAADPGDPIEVFDAGGFLTVLIDESFDFDLSCDE